MKSISYNDILNKCDYLVKVYQDPEYNGCHINYPKITTIGKDSVHQWVTSFILNDNYLDYTLILNNNTTKTKILVPNYAQRMFVDIDITKSCGIIKYATDLVTFFNKDNDQVDSLLELISSKDLNKEAEFCDIFNDAVQNSFQEKYYDKAKELGLDQGFLVCKKLIGGIYE